MSKLQKSVSIAYTDSGNGSPLFARYLCNANKKNGKMESNKIFEDQKNPVIIFSDDHLSIYGNSIDVKPENVFYPLINGLTNFTCDILKIEINLTLVNCSSVKLLLQAMVAADLNKKIKHRSINWFFKDKDELELGEMILSNLKNTKIKFYCMN